jgi:predicted DNA-binding protein
MSRRSPATRRVGRPTAGARAGEKVKDYPQLSVRVPPDIKRRVSALSKVRRTSQWHIITDAIECYFRDLPATEQATVEEFVRRRPKPTKDRQR